MVKVKKSNGEPEPNPNVLIVDDEPNILLSLEFLMKKNGYNVFVGRDGQEAIDTISSEKIDLVILDIMMPEVDGLEVCKRLKSNPETESIKVIFLSAKIKEEEIEAGYQVGADAYITKPYSTRDIVKKVKELL